MDVVKEATERHTENFTCRSWKLLHWKLYCCCTSRESLPDSKIQKLCCAILYFLSFFGTRIPPPTLAQLPKEFIYVFIGGMLFFFTKMFMFVKQTETCRIHSFLCLSGYLSCQLYVFQIYLGVLLRTFVFWCIFVFCGRFHHATMG